jgi:hypothetical protein
LTKEAETASTFDKAGESNVDPNPDCEHMGSVNPETTLLECSLCGLVLEEPDAGPLPGQAPLV